MAAATSEGGAALDVVTLSRIQFGLTAGFHFLFPPLTIGLAWLIVGMMTRYVRTRRARDERVVRFWIKVFGLSFAVGVATGITLEFQFGTNWAQYARFVGDIFGAPLAAEGILSFFLESTFLAVLLLGWKRVSPRAHWFASLMVAVGATLSAFWIIAANSWQQTPAGYHIVGSRAELVNFWAAVFNPSTLPRFAHTLDGALITGSFFVVGISALFILRDRHAQFARDSLRPALILGFVASLLQFPLGHIHAVQVAHTQPAKLAAIEGNFHTQPNAPLLLFGIPDAQRRTVHLAVRLPGLLSLLAHGDTRAPVMGLSDIPRDDWPPLPLTFYPFHLMVILGTLFLVFSAGGAFMLWQRTLYDQGLAGMLFMYAAPLMIPLPFLCNELGWISAEVGRQPWIVYQVLRTQQAVSVTVSAGDVLFSILVLTLTYALLFCAWVYLLRRQIRRGPQDPAPVAARQEVA